MRLKGDYELGKRLPKIPNFLFYLTPVPSYQRGLKDRILDFHDRLFKDPLGASDSSGRGDASDLSF
jgi:hypothetical protein